MKLSTTIKGKYLDQIIKGTKTIEYREINEFWTRRILKIPSEIVFISGPNVLRKEIVKIELVKKTIDDFDANMWFALHLGDIIETTK